MWGDGERAVKVDRRSGRGGEGEGEGREASKGVSRKRVRCLPRGWSVF